MIGVRREDRNDQVPDENADVVLCVAKGRFRCSKKLGG